MGVGEFCRDRCRLAVIPSQGGMILPYDILQIVLVLYSHRILFAYIGYAGHFLVHCTVLTCDFLKLFYSLLLTHYSDKPPDFSL
ncbi:hypothetical protein EV401DRAFT_1209153 [Pisolithus croceorrhizus]|nr:hypothetical protein EV401DRAFT_1209153 [Pisolithus croceorrhizus]